MTSKPKTLLYGDALAAVEQRIVDVLPEIVDRLIDQAREGDIRAAIYLCDRILGRVSSSQVTPAEDRRAPYTEDDFQIDLQELEENQGMRRLLAGIGAVNGA